MKETTKKEFETLAQTAQEILQRLTGPMGYSCKEIEQQLDGRVSWRTLYRWLKGSTKPKRKQDVIVLAKLYKKLEQTAK